MLIQADIGSWMLSFVQHLEKYVDQPPRIDWKTLLGTIQGLSGGGDRWALG
jgi:hypothetical protein